MRGAWDKGHAGATSLWVEGAPSVVTRWVEALCIHKWSRFTEPVLGTTRGEAYALLTKRSGNHLPLG